MKSLETLYEKLLGSEELKRELGAALEDKEAIVEFMRKNGCDADLSEAGAFLREKAEELKASGELTPEQLEQVSGGALGITFLVVWTTIVATGATTAGIAINC